MANQLTVVQNVVQAEYRKASIQKATQQLAQAEYQIALTSIRQKVAQQSTQVEYQIDTPLIAQRIAQQVVQVEYISGPTDVTPIDYWCTT